MISVRFAPDERRPLHGRGVGNKPDSTPAMGSPEVGSSNAAILRVIPERGQVAENSSHAASKESCDVLHDDVSGSKFANEAGVL
jgi:hypothetical protein